MLPVQGPPLGPPPLHPVLWFAAATANLEAGLDDEAAKLFQRLQSGHERSFDLDAYGRSFYLLGQIYERRNDATRARERLGWTPEVTFEEGLARTVAWYREAGAKQTS